MQRTALILGATGLIGRHLVELALASPRYAEIVLLLRRASGRSDPRLREMVVNFDELPALPAVNDVFCTLGTTMRRAGSRAAFYQVDHDFVLAVARAALQAGAEQMLLVSAVGADPRSRNFYLSVKGHVERDVGAVGFPTLHLFRPSLLLGERAETRHAERLAARFAPHLNPLLAGGLSRYRAIPAERVAAAMLAAAAGDLTGSHIHHYDAIDTLARQSG